MSNEVLIVRHAESYYNVKLTKDLNSELTRNGLVQAALTGEYLKTTFPDLPEWECVVSPFKRTLQTAAIIQEITKVKFIVDFRLHEYSIRYGRFTVPALRDKFLDFDWSRHNETEFVIDEGSNELFMVRIRDYLSGLFGRHFLLSHCTPCRTMVKLLSGIDEYPDGLEVRNCSVNHVVNGMVKLFDHIVYSEEKHESHQ